MLDILLMIVAAFVCLAVLIICNPLRFSLEGHPSILVYGLHFIFSLYGVYLLYQQYSGYLLTAIVICLIIYVISLVVCIIILKEFLEAAISALIFPAAIIKLVGLGNLVIYHAPIYLIVTTCFIGLIVIIVVMRFLCDLWQEAREKNMKEE